MEKYGTGSLFLFNARFVMKGAILNKGESGFTLMSRVFYAIQNAQRNYNWLISDVNAYPRNPDLQKLVAKDYIWMTGDEFTRMVEKEDFQWIWAVFSGFSPDIDKEIALQYSLPNVQDNYDIWKKQPFIQHPLASTEILACDSSYVTIVSEHDRIVNDFLASFAFAADLEAYMSQ